MRFPRIRWRLGSLLFAVALVAADFGAFRRSFEADGSEDWLDSFRVLPAEVGAIPLFDAALIGLWAAASRRLRARRREQPPLSAWLWAGFFAGQSLLSGWLATALLPGEFLDARQAIADATGLVAEAWAGRFGAPEGKSAWVACQALLLAVAISGPPLLLAGIGGRLASRSAARLTRARLRALILLIAAGFAAADLAICLLPQRIDGQEAEVALEFRVVEAASGRPVPAALVRITDAFERSQGPQPTWVHADTAGLARMTAEFRVEGKANAFHVFGTFSPWGHQLEAAAPGHRTLRIPLPEVLGPAVDPNRPVRRAVTLAAGGDAVETCEDLAGTYLAHLPYITYSLQIEADGRFAWRNSGYADDTPLEYGRLIRQGATIQFVPVPHPGIGGVSDISVPYCVIRRGGGVLLTPMNADGFKGWCRAILAGPNLSLGNIPGSFLRPTSRRAALPQIPREAWMRILASDLIVTSPADAWRLVSRRIAAARGHAGR